MGESHEDRKNLTVAQRRALVDLWALAPIQDHLSMLGRSAIALVSPFLQKPSLFLFEKLLEVAVLALQETKEQH